MPKNVTIRDIAAAAGVSIALVSFVMNNRIEANGKQKYRVNESTREKILEVAKKLNYQPNSAARTLRRGRSLVIGVILSDISNTFYGEMARQLEDVAFKHGYTVLFGSSDENPEKFERIMQSFIDRGVEGFIVVPCEGAEKSLRHILNVGIPFVVLDRKEMDVPAPKIVLDNVNSMRSAVDYLIGKGIRKIEMVSYTMRVSSIKDREEGYLTAMRMAGMPESGLMIHRLPFEDILTSTERLMPSVVERGVEGIVFATNSLAISGVIMLTRLGVRIQKDIHLVGFDNSDVYSLFSPPIPHVSQPICDFCKKAFSILQELIDGEREQKSVIVTLKGSLLEF